MQCDIDFRYKRALHQDALTTFNTCLDALNEAVADAKLARISPGKDPAVILLSRRLARIQTGDADARHCEDDELKAECLDRLSKLKHRPAIVALILRGIDYNPEAIRHYKREGGRTLRQIAVLLGLERKHYRLDYLSSNSSIAGDYIMESARIHLRLTPQRFGEAGLYWRHPKWEKPGNRTKNAPITALQDLQKLAERLRSDLSLPAARQEQLI